MPQSLAQIYVHLVFSTKFREPLLANADLRRKTFSYLAGICRNLGSPSLLTGGMPDHVHILSTLSRTTSLADLVRELKRDCSKWIKEQEPALSGFHWQDGYGAFSVSPSHVAALKEYIQTQEEHHRVEGFQDEFRRFLEKYAIEYDERYVWD